MYGRAVHEAVIKAGEPVSGATVHLVTWNYDDGPILAQRQVPVEPADDASSLEARVRTAERALLVDTIAAIARGDLSLPGAGAT